MIFVLDVGNTNIKCALFQDGRLEHSWRMSTNTEKTSDEYGIQVTSFLQYLSIAPESIQGIILSSVIPSINYTMEHMCKIYFHRTPLFVGPGIKTGLNVKYNNPRELGTDRIVNAVAAYHLYGGPLIVIDFGTATTFGAISQSGDFLGGAICPGIKIATEALTKHTAKLPHVELIKPPSAICTNTVSAMQAGIIYGYVGQVDYIIRKMKSELGPDAKVIATGGLSSLIAQESGMIDQINPTLTLQGLYILYEKNT